MNDNTSSAAPQHYARRYGCGQGAAGALTENPAWGGANELGQLCFRARVV
jgi:hypothetical protein